MFEKQILQKLEISIYDNLIKDKFGNTLKIESSGRILLNLAKESRTRNIGIYDKNNKIFYKYIKKENFFRSTIPKSIGFCNNLFLIISKDVKVIIKELNSKNQYISTVERILNNGKFFFFKEQGFEKQLFVTIDKFRFVRL